MDLLQVSRVGNRWRRWAGRGARALVIFWLSDDEASSGKVFNRVFSNVLEKGWLGPVMVVHHNRLLEHGKELWDWIRLHTKLSYFILGDT